MRLGAPVQLAGRARAGPLAERRLQALLDEAFADAFNGDGMQADSGPNGRVRLARRGPQQRLCTLVPAHRHRPLGGQRL